jgi:hypothetical protein
MGDQMKCVKRGNEWWIVHVPDMDEEGAGPYDTKADATDDMRGLERFYKHLYGLNKGKVT